MLDDLRLTWRDLYDNPEGARYEYGDGPQVPPPTEVPPVGEYPRGPASGRNKAGGADKAYIAEGEHDVLNAGAEGAVMTCTAMGAGKADKFDLTPARRQSKVIVVMDCDEGGSPARGPDHRPAGRPCRGVGCTSQTGKDADHVVSGNSR